MYSRTTNSRDNKDDEKSRSTGTMLYKRSEDKARPNSELQYDSSASPIFSFSGLPSEHASKVGSLDKNLQSCMSSTKHSRSKKHKNKDSRLETFGINKIMNSALGIHSLTDHTYQEQQLIEEAIDRCNYKDQLLG